MEKLIITIFLLTIAVFEDDDKCPPNYKEVISSNDSLRHWYIDPTEGDNWCWRHNIYENVRIVNPKIKKENEILGFKH